MAKFKVNRPLLHDGKRHEEGDLVELDGAAAKPLLEAGAIAAIAAPLREDDPKGKGEDRRK